jgi:hypothetical protein
LAVVAENDLAAQTGAYLRMLLVRAGEPRAAWEKYAQDVAPGEIDYAAVAQVLREHATKPTETATPTGKYPTETVRAALDGTDQSGTALDTPTLNGFIDAFDLGPRHAARLRDLRSGSAAVRFITGASLSDLHRQVAPPQHETLALHELHTLGPDGLPAEHQTIQVIKAATAPIEAYPYRFDTDELVVEVVRGGHVGEMYRVAGPLYGVDIVLDRQLALGESALMHYRTTFFYRTPPPSEFRRAVLGSMRDVTLWVQFHPDRLPTRVWSGRWDRLDDETVLDQRLVQLDGDLSVQVRYDAVVDAIVGFHWAWD